MITIHKLSKYNAVFTLVFPLASYNWHCQKIPSVSKNKQKCNSYILNKISNYTLKFYFQPPCRQQRLDLWDSTYVMYSTGDKQLAPLSCALWCDHLHHLLVLHLKNAVHISFSTSLFSCPLLIWPCCEV